jgi:hypothetical protein
MHQTNRGTLPMFKFSVTLFKQLLSFFLLSVFIYSCKKNDLKSAEKPTEVLTTKDELQKKLASDFFVKNRKTADMADENNGYTPLSTESGGGNTEYPDEIAMVLGAQLPIPYTIPVMTEAYNTYYASNLTFVPVTDLYVKFSPVNEAQFALLEDSLDLDLYDYPLDYEVLVDGDYYQQPGKGLKTCLNFTPPFLWVFNSRQVFLTLFWSSYIFRIMT